MKRKKCQRIEKQLKSEDAMTEKIINRESLAKLYERYAYASLFLGYFDFCVKRTLPVFLLLFVFTAFICSHGFEKWFNILVYVLVILLLIKLIHEILLLIEKRYQKMVYVDSRIFYKSHVWEVNSNMTGYYLNQHVPENCADLNKLPYSLTFKTIYQKGMQPVKKSIIHYCSAPYYIRIFLHRYFFIKYGDFFELWEGFFDNSKILELAGLSRKFKLMMYEVTKEKIEEEE